MTKSIIFHIDANSAFLSWEAVYRLALNIRTDREALIALIRKYEQDKSIEFEIAEYDSGEALLENTAELQDCRIIFMDINMEQMSELETAAQIKSCTPECGLYW